MYITYNLIKRILYGFQENYDLGRKTDQNAAIPLIIETQKIYQYGVIQKEYI